MPRTRATKTAQADTKQSAAESSSSGYVLGPETQTPSKLFVLPSKATTDARIVTLPNPRHARPARYLVCPKSGVYEFTKISTPKTIPRSWLIETPSTMGDNTTDTRTQAEVTMGAELFLATAIDPLFLVLPALAHSRVAKGSEETKRLFLTSDDHFDKLPEEASHLSEILRWAETRALLESRMAAACETVEAGDETMFRLDEKKLLGVVLEKAKAMGEGGLPPSMEDKFVRKALEAPIMIQKSQVAHGSQAATDSVDSQVSTPQTESADSQSTTASTDTDASSVSQASTAATSFTEDRNGFENIVRAIETTPEITQLQRQRVAFDFICSSYIAPTLTQKLQELLANAETGSVDFLPLDKYLARLAELRSEAMATRSGGDYSRKHGLDDEEEEVRAEKKRKLEEEKQRKANQSRGVRQLKKVNTTGMKKLSEFFKKK